jgi:heme/copper-type cytochrome/quinol oxidase subunit 2
MNENNDENKKIKKTDDEDKSRKPKLERIVFLTMITISVIVVFGLLSVYAFPGKSIEKNGIGQTLNLNSGSDSVSESYDGEVQNVELSFDDEGYVITPNTLKKGVPVRMTVNTNTVTGCMRDVVIKDFGVRKYITPSDNIIEFTPDKEGTFLIACSMNMGRGFFSVTSDGTATADSTAQLATQTSKIQAQGGTGTCGASGGGCGCRS